MGIADVVAQLNAGSVQTLFVLGGNPAYNAPVDLDWKALPKPRRAPASTSAKA